MSVAALIILKPRLNLYRDYQKLVQTSSPLALISASDFDLEEIERRKKEWTAQPVDSISFIYGENLLIKKSDDPIDDFISITTHSAPKFRFWSPQVNHEAVLRLTIRGIISPTISDDKNLYFVGSSEMPSMIFTRKENSSIIIRRAPLSFEVLIKN